MIAGKTHREILDLFDTYRRLHPNRISLRRFCLFCGIPTTSTGKKHSWLWRVDALLRHHITARGLTRQTDTAAHGAPYDVLYLVPSPPPLPPTPSPVRTWRDPSLATWTPAQAQAVRRRELKLKAEMQTAREQEMAEERASVRGQR